MPRYDQYIFWTAHKKFWWKQKAYELQSMKTSLNDVVAKVWLKGNATLKHIVLQSKELYKPWIFYTNSIKIDGELRNLWKIEYMNIGGMGATILNI